VSKQRFVTPETVRLELSDGDWIEVKGRLTYGEQQHLSGSALKSASFGTSDLTIDYEAYAITRLETWLVDWSFVGAKGQQVPVSLSAISNLDPATAAEIDAALTAHIEALEKKA
jgi:hypothetical protein